MNSILKSIFAFLSYQAKGKGMLITFQITRISEMHSLKKQDLTVLNQINNFVEEQKKGNPSLEEKPDEEAAVKVRRVSSQGKIQKNAVYIDLKEESVFAPIKPVAISPEKNKGFPRSSLKYSSSPRSKKEKDDKREKEPEDPQLQKLDHQSQFKQRTQIRKITNILKQSQAENMAIRKTELGSIPEKLEQDKSSAGLSRKINKLFTLANDKEKNSAPSGEIDIQILPLQSPNMKQPEEIIPRRGSKRGNTLIPKDPNDRLPRSITSNRQGGSEDFVGSSVNIEQAFFHKTVNFGAQKIDEYYEILDEIPATKIVEPNHSSLSLSRSSKNRYSQYSKYRTLNDDFETMAQTDSAIENFLLKVHRLWLSAKKNQNAETILDFQQEISNDYAASSQINLVLYSFFNMMICFFWIIVNAEVYGFTGFFATRMVIAVSAILAARMWKSPAFCEFHRTYIYVFYGAIAINIMVFTALNPYIGIVMEIELVACYISITKFPIIGFLESIGMSVAFLVLHFIYLKIIKSPSYLMLHSSVVVILFNLAAVHLKVKTLIDNFNKGRINFVKKKQLNNLIVNLLPNHVFL